MGHGALGIGHGALVILSSLLPLLPLPPAPPALQSLEHPML